MELHATSCLAGSILPSRLASARACGSVRSPATVRGPLRHLATVFLAIASTSVPAGIVDRTEATRDLQQAHHLALRTARAVEDARVAYIVDRYRRPAAEARAIVRAAERAA